ncbi:MAG: hypothetical protein LH613_14640 [Chamaesiphon sp.]|nr:hypothetical protein [Chamaesiphon sp.]
MTGNYLGTRLRYRHSPQTIEGRIFERFDRVDIQDSGAQRSCLVLDRDRQLEIATIK